MKGDTSRTLAAALHDHSIADALDELPDGKPWIGVMGGHGIPRGYTTYRSAVLLGRHLARAGLTVATGGGPGAMEAANLGSSLASYDDAAVSAALTALAAVPSFGPPSPTGPPAVSPYAVTTRATVASRSPRGSTATSRRTCLPRYSEVLLQRVA